MLQKVIEYLVQNPDIEEKVKNGIVRLVGLTDIQQVALVDVLNSTTLSDVEYW